MQPPPVYGSETPTNPDTRALPEGWIQQFDNNYRAWFYVNTHASPLVTTWMHPLGPLPPPPAQYAPSTGTLPPTNSNTYTDTKGSGAYGDNNGSDRYNDHKSDGGPDQQDGYQQSSGESSDKGAGGLPGGLPGGKLGRAVGKADASSGKPSKQVHYQQKPTKKKGWLSMGMGDLFAAGGAGLVGGALIADALDDGDNGREDDEFVRWQR